MTAAFWVIGLIAALYALATGIAVTWTALAALRTRGRPGQPDDLMALADSLNPDFTAWEQEVSR